MNKLYLDIIAGWVRLGLGFLSGFLIQHHIVTAPQGEALSSMLLDQIINSLPALAALAWQYWQKRFNRKVLETALQAPAGTTIQEVKAMVKSGNAPVANTEPPTSP